MLLPIDAEAVATRVLTNLRTAFGRRGELSSILPVLELRANMASADLRDRIEYSNILAALGRFEQAADECDRLAELDEPQAESYRTKATNHRARWN